MAERRKPPDEMPEAPPSIDFSHGLQGEAHGPDPKKRFLLRLDPAVWSVLEKWAANELKSVNGEIEFLLKEALRRAGRLK